LPYALDEPNTNEKHVKKFEDEMFKKKTSSARVKVGWPGLFASNWFLCIFKHIW
jgi:hypothetical protein